MSFVAEAAPERHMASSKGKQKLKTQSTHKRQNQTEYSYFQAGVGNRICGQPKQKPEKRIQKIKRQKRTTKKAKKAPTRNIFDFVQNETQQKVFCGKFRTKFKKFAGKTVQNETWPN